MIPTSVAPEPSLVVAASDQCFAGDAGKGTLCRWIYDRTGNEWLARSSDWLISRPLQVAIIMIVALLLRRVVHKTIQKAAARLATGVPHPGIGRGRGAGGRPGPADSGGTL
ncbi:MAG: mechanosensitive ion channel family protein, partial [Sporichthyaceae bacterium]